MSGRRAHDGLVVLVVFGLALYVLSFGPANAWSRRHGFAWPRVELAFVVAYTPIYLATEFSDGFDRLLSRYCDFCGGELHGL